MNIAICDDEILFTRELSSLLTHWAEKNDFHLPCIHIPTVMIC